MISAPLLSHCLSKYCIRLIAVVIALYTSGYSLHLEFNAKLLDSLPRSVRPDSSLFSLGRRASSQRVYYEVFWRWILGRTPSYVCPSYLCTSYLCPPPSYLSSCFWHIGHRSHRPSAIWELLVPQARYPVYPMKQNRAISVAGPYHRNGPIIVA